eukprot:Nk52_evm5s263 gene=Nk52_evmTU5s263
MSRVSFSVSVICIAFYVLLLCASLRATASHLGEQGKVQQPIQDVGDAADVNLSKGLEHNRNCVDRCHELKGIYGYDPEALRHSCTSNQFKMEEDCAKWIFDYCGGSSFLFHEKAVLRAAKCFGHFS